MQMRPRVTHCVAGVGLVAEVSPKTVMRIGAGVDVVTRRWAPVPTAQATPLVMHCTAQPSLNTVDAGHAGRHRPGERRGRCARRQGSRAPRRTTGRGRRRRLAEHHLLTGVGAARRPSWTTPARHQTSPHPATVATGCGGAGDGGDRAPSRPAAAWPSRPAGQSFRRAPSAPPTPAESSESSAGITGTTMIVRSVVVVVDSSRSGANRASPAGRWRRRAGSGHEGPDHHQGEGADSGDRGDESERATHDEMVRPP